MTPLRYTHRSFWHAARKLWADAHLKAEGDYSPRLLYRDVGKATKMFKTYGAFVGALVAHINPILERTRGDSLGARVEAVHDGFVAFTDTAGIPRAELPSLREHLRAWYKRSAQPRAALTYLCDYTPVAYSVRGAWTPKPATTTTTTESPT